MSQSKLKAERRADNAVIRERILQAHDALHKNDTETCHQQLHAAMGIEDADLPIAPLDGAELRFDKSFRDLCERHGVRATYMVAVPTNRGDGAVRLVGGGDQQLTRLFDDAVRKLPGSM